VGTICLKGADIETDVGATLCIFGYAVVAVSLHFLLTTSLVSRNVVADHRSQLSWAWVRSIIAAL
jgi:hypothetical protein